MRIASILAALLLFFCLNTVQAAICSNSPSVGTDCTFNAYEFSTPLPGEVQINATCRAANSRAYVFVENSLWNAGVTQNDIDALLQAFSVQTPQGNGGIYEQTTYLLGGMPDNWDHNDRLYIVVHDIISNAQLSPVTAYFRKIDLEKDFYNQPSPGSNQHEIVFLHYANLASSARQADLAREMGGICAWGRDPDEEDWVQDALARANAWLMGYDNDLPDIENFADKAFPLTGIDLGGRIKLDHGATLLFALYLADQYSKDLLSDWAMEAANGIEGLEDALTLWDGNADFASLMQKWAIWNYIDDGQFAYSLLELPPFDTRIIASLPRSVTLGIRPYAAAAVRIKLSNLAFDDTLAFDITLPELTDFSAVMVWLDNDLKGRGTVNVQNIELTAAQANHFEISEINTAIDWLYIILSRHGEGPDLSWTVYAEKISTQPDGDDSPDGDNAPDGDDSPDGDDNPDGDNAPDGDDSPDGDSSGPDGDSSGPDGDDAPDGDRDPLIFGDLDCHQVNRCYTDCDNVTCREGCIGSGTMQAQEQWNAYVTCLTGQNREKLNCLDLVTRVERDECEARNCANLSAACKLIEEPTPSEKGGGGCSETAATAAWLLVFAFFGTALLRRRSEKH